MSKINFSKEQLEAIDSRNSSLLVSAAAGSGKTAVLVERIIRKLACDNVNINSLLVVTFTNAAANGMKVKIKKALKELIKQDKSREDLKIQLKLIDSANISTVHSFCLNFIKKYSYMLNEEIPDKFTLLEETERALIMSQIMEEIVEEYYENNDLEFYTLTESYGNARDDGMLISLLLQLYAFLISIPDYKGWIDENLKILKNPENFYDSEIAKSLYKHIISIVKSAYDKYAMAMELIEEEELLAPYIEPFSRDFTGIKLLLTSKDLKSLLKALSAFEMENLTKYRAKECANREIVKEIKTKVKNCIGDLNKKYNEKIIEEELKEKENLVSVFKLFEIILEFDRRFKEEKCKKGTLDFNDLEHITINLLSKDGKLREEFYMLRDSFDEIMVDEYQDTNDVQEAIFSLLSKGDNLFTVGDVKQSIYRFRHANPDLFIKRADSYENKKSGEVINLNANYRCHKNIVDTVNTIFSFIMTDEISEIDYEKTEQLICGGDFSSLPESKLSSELKIALCDSESEDTKQSIEARMVAESIRKMVEDKDFVIDKKRVGFEDIVILVRSFNEKTLDFLNCLKAEGIPVVYEDKTAFFETAEIRNIIAFLKIIDNPYDDISLVTVLRNIFDYNEDELLDIKIKNEAKSFYEAFLLSERIKDKKILSYIKELKIYSYKYEINLLIKKIYDDTFFVEKNLSLINGYKRKENLERLIEIAREYENTEFKGISSFVNYVDKIISGKRKLPNPKLSESSSAVKIMSIHSSKGLEFPIVILAGMHKPFNKRDLNENIVLNSSLGIGYNIVDTEKRYRYKSVRKTIIEENEKREMYNEEMRILYVALTRAKYKLIMSGCLNRKDDWYLKYTNALLNKEGKLSYIDFLSMSCYLDMVIPPLLRHRALAGLTDGRWIKDYNFTLDFSLYDGDNKNIGKDEEKSKNIFENIFDITDKEFFEIDSRVNYKYNNTLSKIPKKISVSGLKDVLTETSFEVSGIKNEIYVPEFQKETRLTAAERGTLIHYIFEKADLEKLRKAEDKLSVILEFTEDNEYVKERLTLSDLRKAEAFFNHPIGIKMLRAKEIYREKDFLMKMKVNELYSEFSDLICDDTVTVQGIIDCFFVDTKGDVYLIDYKYVNKSEKAIRKAYSYQIELYKKSISKFMNIPYKSIKAYIWDVNRKTTVEFN